jgi:hypothetical protein
MRRAAGLPGPVPSEEKTMSKRNSILLALAAVPFLAAPVAANCEADTYGKGVTLTESTAVAAILDAPDRFVGSEVRVEGTVKDVCEMRGCWMEIEAGGESADARRLKVKVKDGVIEFPVAARGKSASVQGKVEKLEMERAKYVKHLKHLADEQGREFDEKSVVGEGPFAIYQIAGSGARICK